MSDSGVRGPVAASADRTGLEAPTPPPSLRRRDRFESYEELSAIARRRLPRSIYTAIAQGSDRGVTLRENLAAFDAVMFRPRAAVAPPISSSFTDRRCC